MSKLSKDRYDDLNNDPAYLISYAHHLERQARQLETEKQMVESERLRLQREVNNLKAELDRLRSPPLFMGYLVEVLDDRSAIVRSTTGPNLVVAISRNIDISKLKPDTRVALNQRTFSIVKILPPTQDPMVQNMELIERPPETYSDIGGLDQQIQEIKETVELPLLHPEIFEKIGIDPPKGILLHGPPGTGKTLLAKAVAHETDVPFIRLIGSELVQKFIGEGARLVREIFEFARRNAPSILFIDELDAIGSRRLDLATSGDREVQRTLMQLLSELDGFSPRGDVKVTVISDGRFTAKNVRIRVVLGEKTYSKTLGDIEPGKSMDTTISVLFEGSKEETLKLTVYYESEGIPGYSKAERKETVTINPTLIDKLQILYLLLIIFIASILMATIIIKNRRGKKIVERGEEINEKQ